eukprot:scaffold17343_cov66-Phaeocystis_antarctica.AAC.2
MEEHEPELPLPRVGQTECRGGGIALARLRNESATTGTALDHVVAASDLKVAGQHRRRGWWQRRRWRQRWRRRMRADFPSGAVRRAVRGPREGALQEHVARPGRAIVGHAVHYQLVIVDLGFEGGRAQELTNSQTRRRDSARLAASVLGGVVGRANAGTVCSARTDDDEVRGGRRRRRWLGKLADALLGRGTRTAIGLVEVDAVTEMSDMPSAVAAASHSEASVIIPEPQLLPLVFT